MVPSYLAISSPSRLRTSAHTHSPPSAGEAAGASLGRTRRLVGRGELDRGGQVGRSGNVRFGLDLHDLVVVQIVTGLIDRASCLTRARPAVKRAQSSDARTESLADSTASLLELSHAPAAHPAPPRLRPPGQC